MTLITPDLATGTLVERARSLAPLIAERAAEAVDVFPPDGQPGRQRMAAEALEILRAGAQGVIQVKAAEASGTGFAVLAVQTDKEGGAAVFFRDAAGYDANHTLMPPVICQHNGFRAGFGQHGCRRTG